MNTLHKDSLLNRFLEHNHGLSVLFCALLTLCWTLPPLFNIGNTYISEGLGFHCSLDWNNSAFHSRIFILSLLICNYFFILFFLIYTNLRVYFRIRTLLQNYKLFDCSSVPTSLYCSINNTTPACCLTDSFALRTHRLDTGFGQRLNRLQSLKVDQHYARITAIMVTQFIIAWTPYAFVSLLNINGRFEFIHQQQILSSVCALLAKLSIILNPLIFIYTSKMRSYPLKHV
ncbi:unnamed protein product [Adineta steineri]|uniref:G-protein coupled receptors family 1 profile domain-containing protein n=1 Tax=Adineta steineri TaxID=433720 RepID=A0A814AXH7_9BILA|nr:unnamed protein product [Adineta steineri]CAF3950423.1 unnamed protein product [Adineta steineri]